MDTRLKTKIMRRVYFIYAVKTIGRPIIAKSFALLGVIAAASVFVSVGSVLVNMGSARNISDIYHFLVSAFANAEVTVQFLSIAAFTVLLFLAIDILKNIFSGRELSEAKIV